MSLRRHVLSSNHEKKADALASRADDGDEDHLSGEHSKLKPPPLKHRVFEPADDFVQQPSKRDASTADKGGSNAGGINLFALLVALAMGIIIVVVVSLSYRDGASGAVMSYRSWPARALQHHMNGSHVKISLGDRRGELRVFVVVGGGSTMDKEVVLLLSGAPLSSYSYRKVIPQLAEKGLAAVAIDLPGLGFSSKDLDVAYTWDTLCDVVHRVIMHMGLSPVHVVSQGLANPIGLRLVAQHPSIVRSLTLSNGPVDMSRDDALMGLQVYHTRVLGNVLYHLRTTNAAPLNRLGHALVRAGVAGPPAHSSWEDHQAVAFLLSHDGGKHSFFHHIDRAHWNTTKRYVEHLSARLGAVATPAGNVSMHTCWTHTGVGGAPEDAHLEFAKRVLLANITATHSVIHGHSQVPQEEDPVSFANAIAAHVNGLSPSPNKLAYRKQRQAQKEAQRNAQSGGDHHHAMQMGMPMGYGLEGHGHGGHGDHHHHHHHHHHGH